MTADFDGPPHVVGAEGRFVLLRAHFFLGCGVDELFMYTAGAGDTKSPSLERIQLPDDGSRRAAEHGLRRVREYGIVPRGRNYLMAALFDAPDAPFNYQLYIYSSESKTWSSSTLLNPNTGAKAISPEKVITLGEGVLGWVDFSSGLLACDLSQEPLSLRLIPLARPLPSNRVRLRLPGASARLFRDLIFVDGVLKFIEIEHGVRVPERPSDPWDNDVLYDSDLIRFLECENMDGKPKTKDGWRAVTWSRMVSSNCWTKGCVVDVADILVEESADLSLICGQSCESDLKLTFRDLYCAFPILSADNGDIVYLKSGVEPSDRRNTWVVVAVHLGNKTVKTLGGFPFEKDNPYKQAFRTSTLSCHLVMTPGIEVSAYQKFIQTARSAKNPNNTSLRELKTSERLGEDVRELPISFDELNDDLPFVDIVSEEVKLRVDVFAPVVQNRLSTISAGG
ncbi:uncharacterized protein [Miscanthus floridulus]|uniref:uncharacterized protein n=1 Tax=Miscanthus floridulus TaxID=154761 RepID=UPI0034592600